MRAISLSIFLIANLLQPSAVASVYPSCYTADRSALCVSSEYKNNKILWSGLSRKKKKSYGFAIFSDGDAYIGEMENTSLREGLLLDLSEKLLHKVRVSDGEFRRLDSGKKLSDKPPCYLSPRSEDLCFDRIYLDTAEGTSDYYIGEVKSGKPNGFGYYFFDGGYYFGNFEEGSFNGAGTYISFSGVEYEGGFSQDAFEGEGLLKMGGASFEGAFRSDNRHGKGKLVRANGEIVLGFWEDDRPVRSLTFDNQADFSAYLSAERQAIVRLQELLNTHFYLSGPVDGILGPSTRRSLGEAVADFGSSRRSVPEELDLNAAEALEPLANLFLEEQGACESTGAAWSTCFVVRTE